ncbi:hypothetical protein VTL71DRAFT_14715 [Oculimacula yallundae]|uniref:Uncharacterized protein n=1 Tax=Oculimacula yallundae TaxID=86028 RepID=A0ABR4CJ92_9HELO
MFTQNSHHRHNTNPLRDIKPLSCIIKTSNSQNQLTTPPKMLESRRLERRLSCSATQYVRKRSERCYVESNASEFKPQRKYVANDGNTSSRTGDDWMEMGREAEDNTYGHEEVCVKEVRFQLKREDAGLGQDGYTQGHRWDGGRDDGRSQEVFC